ncbi:hypothetical protein LQU94_00335 [Peptoniphilus sp. KCTC 25270]|uniref:hypothetical protein n=1 Tax=Peptoniphilus sp. KCTC 25270 TaxID=2897414 RepID=UPI001E64B44A|nr:hypothetical protein [Peptoniphilus sp. KCTC 25270]MCD1146562.1 hypothetical protein [Peptoniphilus sp. KCTC 25270]
MNKKIFGKGKIFLLLFFVVSLAVLYKNSDLRDPGVQTVSTIMEIPLSRETKDEAVTMRKSSFLGDGSDAIVLKLGEEDRRNLEEQIQREGWKVPDEESWEEFQRIISDAKPLENQLGKDDFVYKWKSTNEKAGGRFWNYAMVFYSPQKEKLYYVASDS